MVRYTTNGNPERRKGNVQHGATLLQEAMRRSHHRERIIVEINARDATALSTVGMHWNTMCQTMAKLEEMAQQMSSPRQRFVPKQIGSKAISVALSMRSMQAISDVPSKNIVHFGLRPSVCFRWLALRLTAIR
jgi:hypothetical protein